MIVQEGVDLEDLDMHISLYHGAVDPEVEQFKNQQQQQRIPEEDDYFDKSISIG